MKEFLLSNLPIVLLVYLAINLATFIVYGIDKWKAKHGRWRIKEATLLWLAFLMGGLGALLGMQLLRHKTKHMKFNLLVPLFLCMQAAAFAVVMLL